MAEVKALIEGYRKFYARYYASGDPLYRELSAHGQSPKTLVIACSDSRVDPSIITKSGPGDIFVVRNVANLVPPYGPDVASLHGVSAALEFAVRILEVKHIVILGHSDCAGIAALLEPGKTDNTDFIGLWVNIAAKAREKTLSERQPDECPREVQHRCEKESILLSLSNLTGFPWVRTRVKAGTLTLHGWYFSMNDGRLLEYDPGQGAFVPISGKPA